MTAHTQQLGRPARPPVQPASGASAPEAARRSRPGGALGAYAAYLLLQLLQLLVLARLAPRFFWLDDSQGQFGPMLWWMGQHLEGGRPPLMAPELGMAGNLAADMQYGALDPLHWGLMALSRLTDDFLVLSWGFAALCVILLGSGVLTVLRSYGVPGWLAVAGALGVASSGFFLWYGGSWWPLMWSVAWLPWFWWGLAVPRRVGPLVLGLSTWALLASGNPYVLFFALALVGGQAFEQIRDGGTWRVLLRPLGVARIAAAFGGLLIALPTLLTTVELSSYMSRLDPDPVIGNAAFGVTNLADVLLGGPTLLGQTNSFGGTVPLVPAMYTLVVAVAAVAFVEWRRAIRSPGVVTAGVVYLLAVVFTQLPTVVAMFRYPFRYLVVVQVVLPLLVLIGLRAAPRFTRGRLVAAGALVLAQTLLATFRAPVFLRWHVLAGVLTAVAVAALVVALRGPARADRRRTWAASAVVVAISWGTVFLGEQMMVSLQERRNALDGVTAEAGVPFRSLPPGRDLGTTVAAYEERSLGTDGSATVITYGFEGDMGWSDGVLRSNGNLVADFLTGTGSYAVWHAALNERWCRTYEGATCEDPAELLSPAGDTGTSWLELMSEDTVLLDRDAPEPLQDYFARAWTVGEQRDEYVEYRREDDLPGRVTAASGVEVAEADVERLAHSGEPLGTYTVSTGDDGGWLAFRIPYWPGLEATLDGEPVEVGTVEDAVLRVELPAGVTSGTLAISYTPIGERLLLPATAAGLVLVLAGWAWAVLAGRRDAEVPAGAGAVDR
ncbi:hypothetical protein [Blastococcus sp. KM273129]|uniref:hypothetical protein n=1 Tax=Blastococcus sp. KM273129 TaxID=2570315 RepID=UPI001F2E95F1|nr:hypothetical protein [Blastococcus sp. KM273129]MCF6736808.1 hypothetical protein [Blastococcus sp. KM273129]